MKEVAENSAEEVAVDALDDAATRVDASVAGEQRECKSNAEENSASVDEAFTAEIFPSIQAQQQSEQ